MQGSKYRSIGARTSAALSHRLSLLCLRFVLAVVLGMDELGELRAQLVGAFSILYTLRDYSQDWQRHPH